MSKGFISSVIVVFLLIMITGIMLLAIDYTSEEVISAVNDTYFTNADAQETLSATRSTTITLDGAMPWIIGAALMGLLISVMFVPSHPVFFIIMLFVVAVLMVAFPMIQNSYDEIVSELPLYNATLELPNSSIVENNWTPLFFAFFILICLFFFGKVLLGGGGSA